MYHRILVPVDGSPFSEGVLAYLPQVADKEQSQIILLQVLEQERYGPFLTPGPLPISGQPVAEWDQYAQSYHASLAEELGVRGYQVHSHIIHGKDVAAEICRVAEVEHVDLIAMNTHGRAGLPRWLIGSVASRVLGATDKPVFLVHPTEQSRDRTLKLRRILVPLDGSRLAELPLSVAGALARARDASLILVRALEPQAVIGADLAMNDPSAPVPSSVQTVENDSAGIYMQDIADAMKNTNHVEQTLVVHGTPADVILDIAEVNDVDLIVMSTHGRSGVSRWVYGSVAEKVLHSAPCPLLLLRAPK